LEDQLTDLASKAYKLQHGKFDEEPFEEPFPFAEPFSVMVAPVRAREAARLYVSEKEFETKLPDFRKCLKAVQKLQTQDLRTAISRFCKLVGAATDEEPPFAQMRALFCYGDPRSHGFEQTEADTIKRQCDREDIWTDTLRP
jgi:hypothetical protein